MRKAPKNFRRARIIEENLMEYVDKVNISNRNRDIVIRYVQGSPYKRLAEEYKLSTERIASIVRDYVLTVAKFKKRNQIKEK